MKSKEDYDKTFKVFIEVMLPPIWRKERWVGLLLAISKPLAELYKESVGVFEGLKRRAACDGSIIALEHLIKEEFKKEVKIIEGNTGKRVFLKQPYEPLDGAYLHKERGTRKLFLTPRGGYETDYDYIVKLQETVGEETIQRITAVIGIYNSAGFTYKVENG